jgi:hypothetical protein
VCDVTLVTRALIAVGAALALLIAALGGAVFVTRDEDNVAVDNLLAERLTRAIALAEAERGGRVDLAELAPFAWDEVLIVARGTSREAISDRLGYEWTGELGFQTGELLIFLQEGRVARFADYRGEGRFEGFDVPFDSLRRERAVLEVRDLVISPCRRRRPARVALDLPGVVEVADHEVAVLGDLTPALLGLADARRAAGLEPNLGWAQQRLGRDAGPVGALAPNQLALCERDPQAPLRQPVRRDLAGGAGADHDHVEAFIHRPTSSIGQLSLESDISTMPCAARTFPRARVWPRAAVTGKLAGMLRVVRGRRLHELDVG